MCSFVGCLPDEMFLFLLLIGCACGTAHQHECTVELISLPDVASLR